MARGEAGVTVLDRAELRHALGHFATGVTLVTTRRGDGAPVGLTVNSFGSVSLDPPLVLWNLALASPSLDVFRAAQHFAVNLLSHDQAGLARRFAAPVADRFASLEWREGLGGAPLIEGCAAFFECRRYAEYPGGDHAIFLGQVDRLSIGGRRPLVFYRGGFCPAPAAGDLCD